MLDGLHPNAHGPFFPCYSNSSRPVPADGLRHVVKRFREAHPEIPPFISRDCRRTFKTLAGDAGLSKEIRDRLQNHAKMSDISAKHYDRFDYCFFAEWCGWFLTFFSAGTSTERDADRVSRLIGSSPAEPWSFPINIPW